MCVCVLFRENSAFPETGFGGFVIPGKRETAGSQKKNGLRNIFFFLIVRGTR